LKLMDEKGRLFGKLNIIDLLVAVVILAVIGGACYMLLGRSPTTSGVVAEQKDLYITVRCQLAPLSAADNLKQGDRLVSKTSFADGVIDSVTASDNVYFAVNSDGQGVLTTNPLYKDLVVVLKGRGSPSDAIVRIGGQEMRIGLRVLVKTARVEIQGTVDKIEYR